MKNLIFIFLFVFAVMSAQAVDMEVRFCLFHSSTGGDVDWSEMFPAGVPVSVVLTDGTEIPGMTGTLHPPEDARTYDNPSGWGEVCVPALTQAVDLRVTYAGETKVFKGLPARPNRRGGANYLIWDECRVILDEGAVNYWNEKGVDIGAVLKVTEPAMAEPVNDDNPVAVAEKNEAVVDDPVPIETEESEPATVELPLDTESIPA